MTVMRFDAVHHEASNGIERVCPGRGEGKFQALERCVS